MKRVLDKPFSEGICPCCGAQIEYGQVNHMDNGGTIAWECPNCEASGEEGYDEVFDGMHYNVQDAEGNECVYEPDHSVKPWLNPALYTPITAILPAVHLSEGPHDMVFRAQTRRKGERVWMDGSPVDSNWVYGGVALGTGTFSIIYTYSPIDKYPVYTDTVCQYTGINDMNGTKIFTGDILCVHYGDIWFTVQVRLVNGAFICQLPDNEGYVHFDSWNPDNVKLEVVGNKYDTPELYA